jgi:DNA recombination protein RmuC
MELAIGLGIGVVVTGIVAVVLFILARRQQAELTERLLAQNKQEEQARLEALVGQLRDTFGNLSREALSVNSTEFLKLAESRLQESASKGVQALDAKKTLIDTQLEAMNRELTKLHQTTQTLQTNHAKSSGALTERLDQAAQVTKQLQETTSHLREALANPQRRGQWGERMAEDVLRLAGFQEQINYVKQQTSQDGSRPDFTFFLPNEQRVNMDVKFPLANYLKMLEAEDANTEEQHARQFLRDVRGRIKEVTTRDYIDPAQHTVDYVLVFIPNEQIYGFIHEREPSLLDDALRSKVVLCSPLTLYAMLAVIRQTVDTFRLRQESDRILEVLQAFRKQWEKYVERMDSLGKSIETTVSRYQDLTTTRTRQLDRQLSLIDQLQADREQSQTSSSPSLAAPSDSRTT